MMKPFWAILWVFWAVLSFGEAACGQSVHRSAGVPRLYVSSFGQNPDAVYLRNKLLLRLARESRILFVDDPVTADVVLNGTAAMWLVGYFNSNPRIRYRTSAEVPVYDARMMVDLEDKQGRSLWSGKLKPRFWGSQYVSDNVVNQAARHVSEALR